MDKLQLKALISLHDEHERQMNKAMEKLDDAAANIELGYYASITDYVIRFERAKARYNAITEMIQHLDLNDEIEAVKQGASQS